MRDTQNITIGLLLVTAIVLAAMVAGTFMNAGGTAYAATPIKQNRYMIVTGALSSSIDFLYVLDIAAQRVNVYWIDKQNKAIQTIDSVDLRQAFVP